MENQTRLLNCILIIALSCLFQFANAQIVYTDVNPDLKITADNSYYLDLDNDSISDFKISVSEVEKSFPCGSFFCAGEFAAGTERMIAVTPLGSNKVQSGVYPLVENTLIDSSLEWTNETQDLSTSSFNAICWYSCFALPHHEGPWYFESSSKYLALRLRKGNKVNYGWLKARVDDASSIKIIEFAFNSGLRNPILSGQTCPPQTMISPVGPVSFCDGDSAILSSVNSGTDLSYQWKKDGVIIYGSTDKSYVAKTSGNYKVKVTDNTHACSATSAKVKVKVPCKALNEEINVEPSHTLIVYPNPLSNSTTISFSLPQSENVSLKIFDLQRRLIRTLANENMIEGAHEFSWDASNENGNAVSAGIYFLRLQTTNASQIIQLNVIR